MKVRIKSGECPPYLTVGREYKTILWIHGKLYIKQLNIFINMENCKHLNDGSWEIVE